MSNPIIDRKKLVEFQKTTFRISAQDRLKDFDQAKSFVEERGFLFLWPVKGIHFPSLWAATAGDRPVPSKHDDPGHVTWRWKDQALGMKVWYYAKILRYKATFISYGCLPWFYALSHNFGNFEDDHLVAFTEGSITHDEKIIYEVILKNGPLHRIELRERVGMGSEKRESRFNRALDHLQADFKVVPVGIAEAGTWKYAFIYDLTGRIYPDVVEKSRFISEKQARREILNTYFNSIGAAEPRDIKLMLNWEIEEINLTLQECIEKGAVILGEFRDQRNKKGYALPGLLEL